MANSFPYQECLLLLLLLFPASYRKHIHYASGEIDANGKRNE